MTMGDSNIKIQPPLPSEIAMSSDSHESYSCNKTTNQDQRLKGMQVGSDQTSTDPVIFHTKTENRLILIDSGMSDHYFADKSMFSHIYHSQTHQKGSLQVKNQSLVS